MSSVVDKKSRFSHCRRENFTSERERERLKSVVEFKWVTKINKCSSWSYVPTRRWSSKDGIFFWNWLILIACWLWRVCEAKCLNGEAGHGYVENPRDRSSRLGRSLAKSRIGTLLVTPLWTERSLSLQIEVAVSAIICERSSYDKTLASLSSDKLFFFPDFYIRISFLSTF